MRTLKTPLLISLLLFSLLSSLSAQIYFFRSYDVDNGLSQSQVTDIIQDHHGYLWVSTIDGLNRFDGFQFKVFTQAEGLAGDYIRSLAIDSKGKLYVGSFQGSVCYYQPQLERFATIPWGLDSLKIGLRKIYVDWEDHLWIISEAGQVFHHADSLIKECTLQSGLRFFEIFQLDSTHFLGGTSRGLILFSLQTDTFTTLIGIDQRAGRYVSDIYQDSRGNLWAGTSSGYIWFHDADWPITRWQLLPFWLTENDQISHIEETRDGALWFATLKHGILMVHYDENTHQFTHQFLTRDNGLNTNSVYSLFRDKDGNMWIGLNGGGLQQYRDNTFEFFPGKRFFTSQEIWGVYRDSQRNLWIGGRRGISVIPYRDGQLQFTHSQQLYQIGGSNLEYVMAFAEIPGINEIWIGSLRNGLFAYYKTRKRFYKKQLANFTVVPSIMDMVMDAQSNVWIATLDSGVYQYNPHTNTWRNFSVKHGLPDNRVNAIYSDHRGRIWVGTLNHGIAYIENDTVITFNDSIKFPASYVFDITEDNNGHIWFATSGKGIIEYDGNRFYVYNRQNGFPGNTAYSIIATDDNSIWFTLSNGVAQYSLLDTNVVLYTRAQGFLGQEGSQGAVYKDKDGSIWWGTIRGLMHFNPNRRFVVFSRVPPVITAVELFPEKTPIVPGAQLPHDKTFIRINFSGIDLNYPEKLQFQYRLLPLTQQWSRPSPEKSVLLSHLAPGTYTFELRTQNAFGIASDPVQFSFKILPPWWKQTWFIILVILIGIAAAYGGYSYRIASLESHRRRLEREVIKRTNDLVTEQQKLKEILAALKESEQKFRALAEHTATGIFIYRGNQFVYVNPAAEKMTGYTARELLSMNFWDIIHPDQRELVKQRGLRRQRGEKVPSRYEVKLLHKNGEIRWLDYSATQITFEGQPAAMGSAMDITERKLAEMKLFETQQQLTQLLESIEGFLWQAKIHQQDGNVVLLFQYLTRNFEKIINRPADDFIGNQSYKFVQLIHPDDRENYFATNQLLKKNKTVVREYRIEKQPNQYCWIYEIITPQLNEKGEVVKCSGLCIDITHRREIETQLKNSEKSYRDLFDSIPEAIYIQDVDGTFLDVNDGAVRMYGYPKSFFIGKTPEALAYKPRVNLAETMEYFRKALNGTPQTFEWWGKRSDGTPFPKEVLLTRSQYFGKEVVIAIARDITERKRAEALLRKEKEQLAVTLKSIGDGVISIDAEGRITLTNQAAERLLNKSASELLGNMLSDVLPLISEDGTTIKEVCDRILESHATMDFSTPFLFKADQQTRFLRISSSPIKLTESEIIGYVLVLRDITERRRFEEEILKTQKLESLSVLAGGIAHDFNNILTAILGNISLAKLLAEDRKDIQERLVVAEKATIRAQDLTQQLLTFAKGGTPVKKSTSIADIIKDSSEFGLRGSNVKVEFEFAPDLPLVNVDSGQISQVIQNLVINADQAMPDGGTITIRVEPTMILPETPVPLKPGEYIKIEVEDEGIGIPEEYINRIFDPFFTTKQKGSGLGLASAYSIIKKHDGHIEVRSEIGKGTCFTIYLPVATNGKPEEHTRSQHLFHGTGRILIMDDEPDVRELLGQILNHLGYETDFANDGQEAIEKYQQAMANGHPFDVVIMDLTIPGGMGGADAIKALRKIDPQVCAVVSSGYSNDPIMANYSQYGFAACMQKPYSIEIVSDVLRSVTSNKTSHFN